MKLIKLNSLLLLAIILLLTACSSDDDQAVPNLEDETEGLQLIDSFDDEQYTFDVFTVSGKLEVGYNKVYFRIEDSDGKYVEEAQLDWHPMMTMAMHEDKGHHRLTRADGTTMHHHSCPNSEITKTPNKNTLYEAYIVFLMASSDTDHWELNLHYAIAGEEKELTAKVQVADLQTDYYKVFTTAIGTDEENYILALVEPQHPKVGVNPMEVALFKQESDMDFPIVNHYQLKVDPRMPGMGNHSATGSEDLTQNEIGFYEGKVAFSMTGFWKINLILQNESGEILKGEPVTDENLESSLHFKLEF